MHLLTSGAWERDCHEVVEFGRDLEAEEGRLELLPVDNVAVVLVREELDGGHDVWKGKERRHSSVCEVQNCPFSRALSIDLLYSGGRVPRLG